MEKWEGGRGPGVHGCPERPTWPLPREQAPSGSRRSVASAVSDPRLARPLLACPDFVPLCYMQEKLWKYTRVEMPLASLTRPPEKQLSYRTSWSTGAGSEAGCCSCRDSAPRRTPVQGERQRCDIFKVSQSIWLHPGPWSRRHTE
jgi:hypothetical protein